MPPEELGKDDCFMCNFRAGMGAGKTRAGSETFIWAVKDGGYKFPNLAGAIAEDARFITIEVESDILSCASADSHPEYISPLREN